ncbi:MAG TPA: metalloregulator ArsR/SmtB family transcription factor [Ancylobacter sp.]
MTAPGTDERLALQLRALGHPARLAIVRALAEREKCVCGEIVKHLPLAQSTVSQHLKVLKDAGLITGAIEGPRSCYCLDRANFAELGALLAPLLATIERGPAMRRDPMRKDLETLVFEVSAPISTSTTSEPSAA